MLCVRLREVASAEIWTSGFPRSSHLVAEPVAKSTDVGDADGAEVLGVVAEEDEEVGGHAVAKLLLPEGEPAHVLDVPVGRPVLVQVRLRLAQDLLP